MSEQPKTPETAGAEPTPGTGSLREPFESDAERIAFLGGENGVSRLPYPEAAHVWDAEAGLHGWSGAPWANPSRWR